MENIQYFDSEFIDGHKSRAADDPTRLVHNMRNQTANFVEIFDDLLDNDWCARTYEYSLLKKKPWGVYIPTSDVLDPLLLANDLWDMEPERAIALIATRELFFKRGNLLLEDDLNRIAGTAVWCLSSDVGDSVQYHIDYAELYRYETNIICPPLYAGTYHVTPFKDGDMIGGDFMANIGGLTHYKKFGYKGRLVSPSCLSKDIEESTDWIKVQYKFNRGIIHHGDMPHMSSVIQSIKPYINQPLPLSLPLAAPLATGGASSTKTTVKDNVIAGNGVFQTESRSDLNSSSGPTPLESSVINNLNSSNSKNKNDNENMQKNQNHREIESENEDKNENENETLIENLVISYDEKVESPSSVEENEGSRIEGIDGGVRMTRVILGFNCFPNDQGSELEECCRRAPEHSDAFNRTIKLYQTMTALRGKGIGGNGGLNKESETATAVPFCDFISSSSCEREKISNPLFPSLTTQNKSVLSYSVPKGDLKAPFPKGGLSAAEILKNPALSRLLVLAAKKVKEQREKQK